MRKVRVLVCIFFVLSCVAYVFHFAKSRITEDKNVPVISFTEDIIYVEGDTTEEVLLSGVTATDKEDGDITERIQIASISRLKKGGERTVEYIVFDEANHLGTATRTVVYANYVPPRIYLKQPLRFTVAEYKEKMDNLQISATDGVDGDLTDRIRVSYSENMYEVEAGTYKVGFQVNNRAGDTCMVTTDMVLVDRVDRQMYYPTLKDYIVYTSVGTELNLSSYLTGVASSVESFVFGQPGIPANISISKVAIDSNVDYNTPGVYEVKYSYTTRSGVTATTVLAVVVEE